jgi:hypothetical protein
VRRRSCGSPVAAGIALGAVLLAPSERALAGERGAAGSIDGAFGPGLMMRSQSKALGHLFKPVVSLTVGWQVTERWQLGPGLIGVTSGNEHYRFLGLFARARRLLWDGKRLTWGASLALGGARDADILHRDLRANRSLTVHGAFASDLRWRWGPTWQTGLELGWENLAIARLGLVVSRAWGTP